MRGERVADAAAHQVLEQIDDAGAIAQAQHGLDRVGGDTAIAMGDGLVEQRLVIAHRAFAGAHDHRQGFGLVFDAFLAQQVLRDGRSSPRG